MSLINFYEHIKTDKILNPNFKTHQISLPFRWLINCSSGGGKSNFLVNLLYEFKNTFHKIIIVSKAEETLYDFLKSKLKDNIEIYYEGFIPDIEKMEKGKNGLIVFDDMVLTHDNRIGEMFIRGRKLGFSSVYISQSFFNTPKIIRQNVNLISLGRGMNKRDLRLILSEFALGISVNDLESIYAELTKQPMNFMTIDINNRNIRYNIKDIRIQF